MNRNCYSSLLVVAYAFTGVLSILLVSGCQVYHLKRKVLVEEPLRYSARFDTRKTQRLNSRIARIEFERMRASNPKTNFSEDFRDGFVEGFSDYLTYGGDGKPPLQPPRKYWRLNLRGPEEKMAVNDWYSGFTTGSNAAISSNLREQYSVTFSYAKPSEEHISILHAYESIDPPIEIPAAPDDSKVPFLPNFESVKGQTEADANFAAGFHEIQLSESPRIASDSEVERSED